MLVDAFSDRLVVSQVPAPHPLHRGVDPISDPGREPFEPVLKGAGAVLQGQQHDIEHGP